MIFFAVAGAVSVLRLREGCLKERETRGVARFAFISDIHGNLDALRATLDQIDRIGVDGIICLGDVVGYGPHPSECVEIIAERCLYTVQGNHDLAVIDSNELERFNVSARIAIDYCRDLLSGSQKDWLRDLPVLGDLDEVTVCHASPVADSPTDYIHDQIIAAIAFGGFDTHCMFIGHTHIPIAFGTPDVGYAAVEPKAVRVAFLPSGLPLKLAPAFRYIINPGSIGQPRDGNPDASFGILDVAGRTFTVHRVAYDVEATQQAILRAGLPNFLAARLRVGA
ncbi:MAG: metallophosphoesterase family protein [Planctomycetota bacterium]